MTLPLIHLVCKLWFLVCGWLRSATKWFLRKFTRLCELQRICYGNAPGAPRILGVEKSLQRSKVPVVQQLVAFLDSLARENKFGGEQLPKVVESACLAVAKVKRVNVRSHVRFRKSFSRCIVAIWSYRQLVHEVDWLRKTPYDRTNPIHENKLRSLWRELVPEQPLESRVSSQWGEIGFQGDDPATDFRGMGLLGLENLLYFAKSPNGAGKRVFLRSQHPKYGYSFAIVGINVTDMALTLLRDGDARTHFYNSFKDFSEPFFTLKNFHDFYCLLFEAFDRLWRSERPSSVMEYSRIAEKFRKLVKAELAKPEGLVKARVMVPGDHVSD